MLEKIKKDIESGDRVIYKLGASWCAPCRVMDRVISGILGVNDHLVNRIHVIDIDEYPEISEYFGISSIPVCLFIGNGEYRAKKGVLSDRELLDWFV